MTVIEIYTLKELDEWAILVTREMESKMKKNGTVATGQTLRSIFYEAKSFLSSGAKLDIFFADSGRFIEMQKNDRTKMGGDAIENLKIWIERKGLSSFKYVSGYQNTKQLLLNNEQIVNRIALGIAFAPRNLSEAAGRANKTKGNKKIWWSSAVYGNIGNLYGRLRFGYTEDVKEKMRQLAGE